MAIGDKTRRAHDERAEVLEIIGDVEGKNCLVVDDFSISGGTLVDLARELKKRGAQRIIACLSHLLLNKEAVKRIDDSDIERVIGTDSVETTGLRCLTRSGWSQWLHLSLRPLFGYTIESLSVSSLIERPARFRSTGPRGVEEAS